MSMNEKTIIPGRSGLERLTILPGLFALVGAALVYVVLSGMDSQDRIWFACSVGFFTLMLLSCLFWTLNRRAAGTLLVDCGARPVRWFYLLAAAFSLILFLLQIVLVMYAVSLEPFFISFLFFHLGMVVMFGQSGLERVQICHNGILAYTTLFTWHKISAYEWVGESGCTLRINTTRVLSVLGRRELQVPPELKETVERRLQESGSFART